MRLTLIIPTLDLGGAERTMSNMANYWAEKGWAVTLLTFDDKPPFYDLDPGAKHIALGIAGESRNIAQALLNNLRRIPVLRAAIRGSNPQVVISFMDRNNVLALASTRGLQIPVIVSERVFPPMNNIGYIWSLLCRLTYGWSQGLVVQTERIKQYLSWLKNVWVIPNPVLPPSADENAPQDLLPSDKKVVLAVGRLAEQKGFDLLIHSFAQIASDYPEWNLAIFGEGEERARLEAQRDLLGLTHRVSLPGATKHIYAVMRKADLFVLSSRYEGFPNVLCEAMARGLPVISFDCPTGPRAIIRDGIDGVLVPNGDVHALAQTMARLMGDPEERQRLAARAPEVLERFSLEKVMGMWETLLGEVVR